MSTRSHSPPKASWAEVCGRRLARHLLCTPAHNARTADIVAVIVGAHAQVLSAAELSIAISSSNFTRADIQHAL
jgi:hypothetical protein